ncbi:nickel-type superoxide dismutase maturation protease [Aliamphritea ceti]|uniref:nickel-type superoxide dismutase maturation protease n=1 Tax=Aliamphritea ceti TaxID=1524258 RepID=UPI0021C35EC9|nr:nickel-type superoxide dismutase maturation protease [Aliamphritea ceti]
MISIHRVRGQSMLPTFSEGDYVLCLRPLSLLPLKVGDVVVVQHPRFGRIIKRIETLNDESAMWLRGDNPQSTSSETMGWLARQALIGRVVLHIAKPVSETA